MNHISQEEKIDYIYDTLKKNERKALFWTLFKWGFRVFILIYLYYFITTGLPAVLKNFIPAFPSFGWSENTEIQEWNINQELLKQALENYLK